MLKLKNIDQKDKIRFEKIIKFSSKLLVILLVITAIISHSLNNLASMFYGYFIGLIGFISIIYSIDKININSKYQSNVTVLFLIRYLFYALALFLGGIINLNIITMLVGFLTTNIAIKLFVMLEERGIIH